VLASTPEADPGIFAAVETDRGEVDRFHFLTIPQPDNVDEGGIKQEPQTPAILERFRSLLLLPMREIQAAE